MNRIERGGYFDIIQAQRKFGRMDLDLIKKILGHDFENIWPSIKIIMTEAKEKFYIFWLEKQSEKRNKYCASRSINRNKGKINKLQKQHMKNICGSSVEHMEIEIEDENDTEIKIEINPIYRECSDLLKSRIIEKRKAIIDELKLIKWDRVVKLMIEKDKYSQQDIIDTINACHDMPPNAGGFTWADNILSMATLREKMKEGKIYPKMNIGRIQGNNQQSHRLQQPNNPANQEL